VKQRMMDLLGSLNARVLAGTLMIVLGLGAFESWILLLRAPLAEYRKIRATHVVMAASLRQFPGQIDELGRVASELKLLKTKLSGQLKVPASDDEMVASLMTALDQSAARFGIALTSMTPGPRQQVSVFEEVSFGVIGNGNYLQLCQWMLDFEQTLGGSATITDFDMKAAGEAGQVTLTFNIALYRPLKLVEGAHDF
jgi:Tfp pilus assembly protein PilO